MPRRGAPVRTKYRPYPKYPFPRIRGLRQQLSVKRAVDHAVWSRSGPGGSNLFSNLAIGLLVTEALWRRRKRRPQVLAVDKLKPGQSITVSTQSWKARGR